MNKTNVLVAGIAVVALVVGLLGFYKPAQTIIREIGAQTSNVSDGGCLFNEGAHHCIQRVAMKNASTTCSFKLPAATTTLVSATASFTNTYGGSFDVQWGKSASAFATTTSLGYKAAAISSGDLGSFNATSTLADNASLEDVTSIIAPNNFLNFKIGTTSVTIQGSCVASYYY